MKAVIPLADQGYKLFFDCAFFGIMNNVMKAFIDNLQLEREG